MRPDAVGFADDYAGVFSADAGIPPDDGDGGGRLRFDGDVTARWDSQRAITLFHGLLNLVTSTFALCKVVAAVILSSLSGSTPIVGFGIRDSGMVSQPRKVPRLFGARLSLDRKRSASLFSGNIRSLVIFDFDFTAPNTGSRSSLDPVSRFRAFLRGLAKHNQYYTSSSEYGCAYRVNELGEKPLNACP